MSLQIQQLIENCAECQTLRPSQHAQVIPYSAAVEPMHSVSMDLFEAKGRHYLVMVDRFIYYIWVKELRSLTTDTVLKALESWFKELGYPLVIISDNGPQFRQDFKDYCGLHHIIHSTSSPYNPRSNGLAESAVKAAKHLLLKSSNFNEFQNALLAWQNTPTSGEAFSPAEKFFKRRQRSELFPSLPSLPAPVPGD